MYPVYDTPEFINKYINNITNPLSKESQKWVVDTAVKFLRKSGFDDETLANCTICIHKTSFYTGILQVMFLNGYLFITSTVIWVATAVSNYYFSGCIITDIERELLNKDSWTGFASTDLSSICNMPIADEEIKLFLKVNAALIISIIILRLMSINKFYAYLLLLILTPLLFYSPK